METPNAETWTTQTLSADASGIAQAAAALRRGEVVGMPTETVYGLAGDGFNPVALARIFAAKERPTFDPLILHVFAPMAGRPAKCNDGCALLAELGVLNSARLSPEARSTANTLMDRFWPGPLTLVLPKSERVPDLATSGLDTAGFRMPAHPIAQALIEAVGRPLAAPSANRFGRISPTSAADVRAELDGRIPWILDGGPCAVGVESTVVQVLVDGRVSLLRPGGVSAEAIIAACGGRALVSAIVQPTSGLVSPGSLASHYAPRKKLRLLSVAAAATDGLSEALRRAFPVPPRHLGFLAQSGDPSEIEARVGADFGSDCTCRVLSPGGDVNEAARNLFRHLRELDESAATELAAEPWAPNEGLGFAINDRLKRAAHRD